jgi:hypothetical protein
VSVGPGVEVRKPVNEPKFNEIPHFVGEAPPLKYCHAGDQLSV